MKPNLYIVSLGFPLWCVFVFVFSLLVRWGFGLSPLSWLGVLALHSLGFFPLFVLFSFFPWLSSLGGLVFYLLLVLSSVLVFSRWLIAVRIFYCKWSGVVIWLLHLKISLSFVYYISWIIVMKSIRILAILHIFFNGLENILDLEG